MHKLTFRLLLTSTLFLATASAQPSVLFVGDMNAWAGNSGDPDILTYLQGRYGMANVTYMDTEPAGALTAASVLGYDVVVLSSTPGSNRYRNVLHDSPVPIVNMEEAVAGDRGGEFAVTQGRTKETEVDHQVLITTNHPITAGFTVGQTVQVMGGTLAGQELWWSTGMQAPGASSLAEDDDTSANLFVTIVDSGGTLLTGAPAPCRRVMFGMTDRSFSSFTPEGQRLFGQAVDWAAAGCCAYSANYGSGLAGTNGVPTLTASAAPVFGTPIDILASNSSGLASQGILFLGLDQIAVPVLGGELLTLPLATITIPIPASGVIIPANLPPQGRLGACPTMFVQLLQTDAAAPFGISMTPGLRLDLGY